MVDIKFIERNLSCPEEIQGKIRRFIYDEVHEYGEKSIADLVFTYPIHARSFPSEPFIWKGRFGFSRSPSCQNVKSKIFQLAKNKFVSMENFSAGLLGSALAGNDFHLGDELYSTKTYDGEPLFSTTHKSMNGDVFSNKFSNDLSLESFLRVTEAMNRFTGDSGEYLGIKPDTIIVPNNWKSLKILYGEIFKEYTFYLEGYDSPKPPRYWIAVGHMDSWKIIRWSYLNRYVRDGDCPWILFDSGYNELAGGAIRYDRVPLEVTSWRWEEADMNVWEWYSRTFGGFSDWRAFAVGGCKGGTALEA